jgi:hypothetical protein
MHAGRIKCLSEKIGYSGGGILSPDPFLPALGRPQRAAITAAEVGIPHLRVIEQLVSGAGEHQCATFEYEGTVCKCQGLSGILLNECDSYPHIADTLDKLEDLGNKDRSQPQGWLIQKQESWPRHEAATHRQHLLLSATERAGLLIPALTQARKTLEHFLYALAHSIPTFERTHHQVLTD